MQKRTEGSQQVPRGETLLAVCLEEAERTKVAVVCAYVWLIYLRLDLINTRLNVNSEHDELRAEIVLRQLVLLRV